MKFGDAQFIEINSELTLTSTCGVIDMYGDSVVASIIASTNGGTWFRRNGNVHRLCILDEGSLS